jgi:hypothetical protein
MLRVGFALLFGCAAVHTLTAQPVIEAAPQLITRISSLLPRRATVSLEFQNLSTLPPAELSSFRTALEESLRKADLAMADTQPDARLRVTISEDPRGLLFVVELAWGENRRLVMLPWVAPPPTETKPHLAIYRKLALEQSEPILDLLLNSDSELLVASPASVTSMRLAGGKWTPTGVMAIPLTRPSARDPRGRLQPAPGGFRVYIPGTTCAGSLQPALRLTCTPGNEAWLANPRDASLAVRWVSDRNVLESASAPGPFYSAAQGWLAATDQRIASRTGEPLRGADAWGSDIASVESSCTPNPVVLAAGSGDSPDRDQIQAYEIVRGQAIAASEAIATPGPVTALWPAETPGQVTAVIRNSKTGNYEASRLGVACAE